VIAIMAAGCSAGPSAPPAQRLNGQKVEVVAVWSGAEQRHFEAALREFTRQTGVSVTSISAGYGVPSFLQAHPARLDPA